MTRKEHIKRHKMLHAMADELYADYLVHNLPGCPEVQDFFPVTVNELMSWSHKQTTDPDEDKSQERLDSFVDAVAGKRLTFERLTT